MNSQTKTKLATSNTQRSQGINSKQMTKPGSSKITNDQLVDNSESLCGQCRKLVKYENPAIECEICQQWYHIKCQGIKKAECECIKGGGKKNYLSKLHWYCQTSEENGSKLYENYDKSPCEATSTRRKNKSTRGED